MACDFSNQVGYTQGDHVAQRICRKLWQVSSSLMAKIACGPVKDGQVSRCLKDAAPAYVNKVPAYMGSCWQGQLCVLLS
jgi:hypothetical protein